MLKFKIIGTNAKLKQFLNNCRSHDIPVSTSNSFFRDDYEHCLMPCYAYDEKQPLNTKLQTLHFDSYNADVTFDLKYEKEYSMAISVCKSIISAATFLKEMERLTMCFGDALRNFEYLGNILEGMDAMTEHDETQLIDTEPIFEAYEKSALFFGLPNLDTIISSLEYENSFG